MTTGSGRRITVFHNQETGWKYCVAWSDDDADFYGPFENASAAKAAALKRLELVGGKGR